MSKLLYEYQADFEKNLERAIAKVTYNEISLKVFLDLGFNNSKLLKKDNSDWEFDTGYKTTDRYAKEYGTYFDNLTDEMLKVKVKAFGDVYEDLDGYYCMDIVCINPEDYEIFDKALEKEKENELS